jgi:hypothetical protein
LVPSDDPVGFTVVIYNEYGGPTSGTVSGLVYCDINFNTTKDVLRNCYRCNLKSLTGELTKQNDKDHQPSYDFILEAQTKNDTCWQLDINTFFLLNGDYTLTINATWEGVQHSIVVNESIGVLDFVVQNEWWMSILPWAVPLGAVMCAAVVTVVYMRFSKTRI